jgi:hypothetical protein
MSSALTKNVLFYSRFCQYSNEVVRTLTKKDLRSRFVMVCVDNNRQQLPGFVDRVPLILTSDRIVLADDDVFRYLDAAEGPSDEPLAAESVGGISGDFAFLDGSTLQGDGIFGFTSFGMDTPRIHTPPDDSVASARTKNGGGGGGDGMMGAPGEDRGWPGMSGGFGPSSGGGGLDCLLASRENELNAWRSQQPEGGINH